MDPLKLRAAFGTFMTGVTVVTALGERRQPVGFTANSFTSVSLDPPLLLVCPGRHLSSFSAFAAADRFAVSILSEGQEQVSNIFARFGGDRFGAVDWHADADGLPLIGGAAACFSCTLHQRIEAGDHLILIGRVTGFETHERAGLGYGASGYFSLTKERQAEASARGRETVAAVILEQDGAVLMRADGTLPELRLEGRDGARSALAGALDRLGLAARLGPVYAIYDDAAGRHHITLRATCQDQPAPGGHAFRPLADPTARDPVQAEMLARFAEEYRSRNFSLYIGDADGGEVHMGSE